MPWISIIAFFGHCKLYLFKVLFDGPVWTNLALYFQSIWLTFQRIAFDYFDFRFETAWKEPGGWSPHQSIIQIRFTACYGSCLSDYFLLDYSSPSRSITWHCCLTDYIPHTLSRSIPTRSDLQLHLDFQHFHMHHSPLTYQETIHAQAKWCLKSQRSVPSEISSTGKRISKSKSKSDRLQVLGVGNRIQFLPPLIDWY